jgi:phosphomethylpyrimidine synthase
MMARIFLSRRSVGEGGCSMRITEDVRKFAAEQKLSEDEALRAGMEQKAKEFVTSGAELYAKS